MKSLVPWRKHSKDNLQPISNSWNSDFWNTALDDFFFGTPSLRSSNAMPIDVSESEKEYEVRAELPGLNEKDISLTWNNGVLNITAKKENEREEKGKNSYYRECSYGSVSRDISLNTTVDWSHAKAAYKKGVLTVTLPKTEEAKPRSIEIKVN